MLQEFLKDLEQIYKDITEGNNPDFKSFKNKWNVSGSIGETYQSLCKKEHKKETGSFYTPMEVVDFIVDNIITDDNYLKNPYMKILDPSCGGGYFLLRMFDRLMPAAESAGIEKPGEHILKNNLFGYDIDSNAVMITTIEFYEKTGYYTKNIECMDFLIGKKENFDVILGNPPYMGHKVITEEYRDRLHENYKQVFSDKGDLNYCFIKRAIDSLISGGRLVFFTSRYILEASNGVNIRRYIKELGKIETLIDFYGVRIIKGVGVDNIILNFIKNGEGDFADFYRVKESAKGMGKAVFEDISRGAEKYSKHIKINLNELKNEGFSFLNDIEASIINKIRGFELSTFCDSFQGIITGCDDAFVIDKNTAEELNIETELLKPWIKSKNIEKFTVGSSNELLIYSDIIKDEKQYINAVKYIERYRERLEKRRECAKGLRKWYGLQWGRNPELFEGEKIVYPYKASRNRFAFDRGNYFSADVYAVRIKEMFLNSISYEFLTGVLNSSLYEFYIKTMAKKLGDNLYEYYPNKIMTLKIPDYIKEIEEEVLLGRGNRYNIDMILINYFGITLDEYSVIRSWCA